MKIQQNKTGQYTITLPKPLVAALQWKKGDELNYTVNEDGLIIKREQ